MSAVALAARLALGLALLGVLVPACVRLETPDAFSCSSNADCSGDEHCSRDGLCKPKGVCDVLSECAPDESCQNQKCVRAECYQDHEDACGSYGCDTDQNTCYDTCFSNYHCHDGYRCSKEGKCEAGANLANGEHCTDSVDCASTICCGPAASSVCSETCNSDGDTCKTDGDCSSGRCCAKPGSAARCQRAACEPQAAGLACLLPEDCASGYCISHVCTKVSCQRDDDCSRGYCAKGSCETEQRDVGEACETDDWCKSDNCSGGVCRGEATAGEHCGTDNDCEAGSICCAGLYDTSHTCSEPGQGCEGANGDDCSVGGARACSSRTCLSATLCTQACASDVDCGISPWGSKNHCRKNGVGDHVCFPGCNSDRECADHFEELLGCITGVCAGDDFSPAPLQLW